MRTLIKLLKTLRLAVTFVAMGLLAILFRIFPSLLEYITKALPKEAKDAPKEHIENFKHNFNFRQLRFKLYRSMYLDAFMEAEVTKPAFNTTVFDLSGQSHRLFDFMKKGRPLVLNFGSCTWPPFMMNQGLFKSIVHQFSSSADFLVVYIEEVHPFHPNLISHRHIKHHKTITDRIEAAQILADVNYPCSVVVDDMADEGMHKYGGRPEKLVILLDGIVVYLGSRGPHGYKMKEVKTWLNKFTGVKQA